MANNDDAIHQAVIRLVQRLMVVNKIRDDQIISLIISQTDDLDRVNAATALRTIGFAQTPLFCCREPDYPQALPRIIRVLLTFWAPRKRPPQPIYLEGAVALRRDIDS